MTTDTPRPGRVRSCWNCGADMGFIENRHYLSTDTCGSSECARAEREQEEERREEAHARLDRDNGWD